MTEMNSLDRIKSSNDAATRLIESRDRRFTDDEAWPERASDDLAWLGMTRHACVSLAALLLVMSAACGSTDNEVDGSSDGSTAIVPRGLVAVPERQESDVDSTIAGRAVDGFGFDLFAAAAAASDPTANVVISPLSIAVALGMVEPGATGDGAVQLRSALRIEDSATWHASINALARSIEKRELQAPNEISGEVQDAGELHVNIANAAFTQPGYPFLPAYLNAVGTDYGAAIEELDFQTDQAAAAERINEFIAEQTDDRITDLLRAEDIDPRTVLALVNALLLQASWQSEFAAADTADADFARLDGSSVTVPLMHGNGGRSGRGDGWVAASKPLVGGLRFEVVLPDSGRFDDVAARFDDVVAEFGTSTNPGGELAVPQFETRVTVNLNEALQGIGVTAPFEEGSLLGIADDPLLLIDKVLHQTWLSIDEQGIEAAAATIVLIVVTSAQVDEPVPVIIDRPFLFRIVDDVTGAPLFVGRIMDPTA